jgi:hypothetical protein
VTLTAASADSHVDEPPDEQRPRRAHRRAATYQDRSPAGAVADQIERFGREVRPGLAELLPVGVG